MKTKRFAANSLSHSTCCYNLGLESDRQLWNAKVKGSTGINRRQHSNLLRICRLIGLLFILLLFGCSTNNNEERNDELTPEVYAESYMTSPYRSESPVIEEMSVTQPLVKVGQGDLWYSTWADDDSLYNSWGDGRGFDSLRGTHHGLGKVSGTLPEISLKEINLNMPLSDEVNNSKPSSLLFHDGRLYVAVHAPLIDPLVGFIAYSDDYGKTFSFDIRSSKWTSENNSKFKCLMFINMGKNYELNSDQYVYAFGKLKESWGASEVYLARVPVDQILRYDQWRYFAAIESDGQPVWSSDQSDAIAVDNIESTWQLSSAYHPGIQRYLVMTGNQIDGRLYDAPNPWGPWTLAGYWYTQEWNDQAYYNCYMPGIITKDMEPNSFYFTTSGATWDNEDYSNYKFTLARIALKIRE